MQPPAAPAPPHARPRILHWSATTVALGAVVALAGVSQPLDATARSGGPVGRSPQAARAHYPMECGSEGDEPAVTVLSEGSADFDGDGTRETTALVRCSAGSGTPPSGIFVVTGPAEPGERPHVVETLLSPAAGMIARDFAVSEHTGTVAATLLGYSSADVPRCCPDQRREVTWHWREGRFVLVPQPVARSV